MVPLSEIFCICFSTGLKETIAKKMIKQHLNKELGKQIRNVKSKHPFLLEMKNNYCKSATML